MDLEGDGASGFSSNNIGRDEAVSPAPASVTAVIQDAYFEADAVERRTKSRETSISQVCFDHFYIYIGCVVWFVWAQQL